jgi:hypothetical protein
MNLKEKEFSFNIQQSSFEKFLKLDAEEILGKNIGGNYPENRISPHFKI